MPDATFSYAFVSLTMRTEYILNYSNPGKTHGDDFREAPPVLQGRLFLFPTLGGLLYGYDVGATSSDIISLQDYRCGSGIKISNQQGTLTDGRVVAVKKLSVASHQGKSQFVAEIATISAVQHRNLVKLYGCCIEGDKRLLVYEYLENNNLEKALFGKTNLFLDCGYLAPEYAMRGHLTEKTDVFGFGVVALEVVSGRSNSDSTLEDDRVYLLEWVYLLLQSPLLLIGLMF
ncbi:hypothetical protein POM88_032680 [Heracleum sosnowskyi]|uniref:Protein kinase domain-containing protein n=1 Tax=Heracleum sosnowskyi TaxID=360622 RepID=A0AAD8MKV3_9APIA|nr:hypothetical protein POM88_032680 [Heracleum sosnowskyi]